MKKILMKKIRMIKLIKMANEYYQKIKEKLQKEAHERYQNLSEEIKDKRQKKTGERHQNITEEEKNVFII